VQDPMPSSPLLHRWPCWQGPEQRQGRSAVTGRQTASAGAAGPGWRRAATLASPAPRRSRRPRPDTGPVAAGRSSTWPALTGLAERGRREPPPGPGCTSRHSPQPDAQLEVTLADGHARPPARPSSGLMLYPTEPGFPAAFGGSVSMDLSGASHRLFRSLEHDARSGRRSLRHMSHVARDGRPGARWSKYSFRSSLSSNALRRGREQCRWIGA